MASKFLVPDRDQSFLRVASYRDLLGDDGLVWTVIGVVEGLGLVGCLCPLRQRHRPGGPSCV